MYPFLYGEEIKRRDFGFYRTYSWVQTYLLITFLCVSILEKIIMVIMKIYYRNRLTKEEDTQVKIALTNLLGL